MPKGIPKDPKRALARRRATRRAKKGLKRGELQLMPSAVPPEASGRTMVMGQERFMDVSVRAGSEITLTIAGTIVRVTATEAK